MKNMVKGAGERYVMVLTARGGSYKPIKDFMKTLGLNVKVITLGSGDPWDKRDWIGRQIEKNKFDDIVFFDDSRKNIKAVDMLKDKHPKVKERILFSRSRGQKWLEQLAFYKCGKNSGIIQLPEDISDEEKIPGASNIEV